jgi:2-dehydro-3-deoxyglucarate aldolase
MKLAWQQIPSTVVSEILCNNDLGGVVLDTEHGCFNNETLYACIQIITSRNKQCFVRLSEVDKTMIRYCLDAGATGLIFSTIESIEQCKRVKEYSIFPSHGGRRGLGLVRENKWGEEDLVGYSPILVAQIETHEAIQYIDEMCALRIFSYFMIGPYDLSASLGVPGDFACNKYLDVVNSLKERIPLTQMAVHIPTDVEKHLKKYEGYGMMAMGMDTISILEFYKKMSELIDIENIGDK